MVERRKPIPVEEAVKQVMNRATRGEVEHVPIVKSNGRYVAVDIVADHDVPPFNRSPYDGFAIRAEDSFNATENEPVEFEIIDSIGAGVVSEKKIGPNETVRIMTGTKLPHGGDAVVMYELAKEFVRDGKSYMSIKRPFQKWSNISFQGEDTKKGAVLVKAGTYINPGVMALLATFGYDKVPVVKKPTIGILSTGTELLDVHEPLAPGKIRNSNAYMVYSQVIRSGAIPKLYAHKSDDVEACFEAIQSALREVDILITTGGVSVGDYDYLPEIYKRLSANVLFNKIAMRPGSVTTVAELNGQWLFGLSGNPSACFVGYELFVRPLIKHTLYSNEPHPTVIQAYLTKDFLKPNPFTRFVRSRIDWEEGRVTVTPVGLDKSSMVSSLSEVNALTVLPGGTRGYEKGMIVNVFLLDEHKGCEWPWGSIKKYSR